MFQGVFRNTFAHKSDMNVANEIMGNYPQILFGQSGRQRQGIVRSPMIA